MRGVVWVADIWELTTSPRLFFCENGIKRRHASLIRQMAKHLNVLCRGEI